MPKTIAAALVQSRLD